MGGMLQPWMMWVEDDMVPLSMAREVEAQMKEREGQDGRDG